jgi:PAS domain-containing protein
VSAFEIFRVNPLGGTSVLLCLATIFWCVRVIHRRQAGPDRFLLALLGLIATTQGLRVLQQSGLWRALEPMHRMEAFVDLIVAGLYLVGALMLEISSRQQISANLRLRIVESNFKSVSEAIGACLDPVVMLDGGGYVKHCNDAAERLLGFTREQMMGRKILLEPGPQISGKLGRLSHVQLQP